MVEVKESLPRTKLNAYLKGIFQSVRQQEISLSPFRADFPNYDRIEIYAPVWAGMPAPAFNTIVHDIPEGANVAVSLISSSGKAPKARKKIKELFESKGINFKGYRDIKA